MKIVVYRDKKKEYRWKLYASNGRIVADSGEGYKKKRPCMRWVTFLRFGSEVGWKVPIKLVDKT